MIQINPMWWHSHSKTYYFRRVICNYSNGKIMYTLIKLIHSKDIPFNKIYLYTEIKSNPVPYCVDKLFPGRIYLRYIKALNI